MEELSGQEEQEALERLREANRDLDDAASNLRRTDAYYQRTVASSARYGALREAHGKWAAELIGWSNALKAQRIREDDLDAIRAGRPPLPATDTTTDPPPPGDDSTNLEDAVVLREQTDAHYQKVRRQHDTEHQNARAAWEAALDREVHFRVVTRANTNGVGSGARGSEADPLIVNPGDAPRCPDHPAIVLQYGGRRPGWCPLCKRKRPMPGDLL